MRARRFVPPAAAVLALSAIAAAQSFNVDYGDTFGTPSPAFGAAAGQAGPWNTITGLEDGPVALVDVAGRKTSVVIVPSLPFGAAATGNTEIPADDQPLLDDYFDLHSVPATFQIQGLAPGAYAIYTYAWAPDDSSYRTFIGIDGRRSVLVGGAWPGGFVEGITHARHVVGAAAGRPVNLTVLGLGHGTLNGIQIVRLGEAR